MLHRGRRAVEKSRVTITDIARAAGTSTATVSNYLNGKWDKLGEKTRTRIATVIHDLGYVPNAQAQVLTGKQTHVIAVLILDNSNIWAGQIFQGIEQVALECGYQTVICNTDFNTQTESLCVEKMLSLGVDGFIVQPTTNFKAISDRIQRAGKAVVFYDCNPYNLASSWVKTNLYDGIYSAITTCVEHGYQDFVTIGARHASMRTRIERHEGFADALGAHGIGFQYLEISHTAPSASDLTRHFQLKLNPAHKTLIFVENQWALARVYQALKPMAHLIPKQIGLLGMNNQDWTGITSPSISTVVEPVREVGRLACTMLLDQLENGTSNVRQEILNCSVNWLESTM